MLLMIFFLALPSAHAASGLQSSFDGISQSGIKTWNAFTDFIGEVWSDAKRIASSFFGKILGDIGKIFISIFDTAGKLIPPNFKKALGAVGKFFLQVLTFIIELLKNIFSFFVPHKTQI